MEFARIESDCTQSRRNDEGRHFCHKLCSPVLLMFESAGHKTQQIPALLASCRYGGGWLDVRKTVGIGGDADLETAPRGAAILKLVVAGVD